MPANSYRGSGSVNVLLVGSGGREHALASALAKSPQLGKLLVAPGNPGTEALGRNVQVGSEDNAGLLTLAQRAAVDLVVIGPEVPLVAGLVDRLSKAGIVAFGPTAAAAQLEGSKGFTKDLCREFAIPTAAYARFTEAKRARQHVMRASLPVVIKADGLAAGKGVVIAATLEQAEAAIDFMFGGGFGAAGASVVIEDFLEGEEISFFALCDGTHAVPLGSAKDHKRLGEGDTGPNTGGMGAVSPAPAMTPALQARIMRQIIEPTLAGMRARGAPFKGMLFAGLMLTKTGPQLIEFNVRFGDPETQAILPRLDQDILPLLLATAEGRLPSKPVRFRRETALAVVLAAQGYPEAPLKGTEIRNLGAAAALPGVSVFQAGTRRIGDRLLADGGRVLTVVALGADTANARSLAYRAVDAIDWPDGFCRRDIGDRALAKEPANGG